MFCLSSFYQRLVCHRFIGVMLFVVLLTRFICVGAIQTSKTNLINQRYQIMEELELQIFQSLLFHHVWFLAICILDLSIYYKFESIILFSFQKKVINKNN